MSLLVRTTQIFSVFCAGATIPLSSTFAKENLENINSLRNAGGGEREIAPIITSVEKEAEGDAMMEAIQKLNKENQSQDGQAIKWGCFWFPDFPVAELFFCFNQSNLESPALFHWKGGKEKKLSWVQGIARRTILQLKGGETQQLINSRLRALLGWTQKWPVDSPFIPSTHCTMVENVGGGYKLTCNNPHSISSGDKKPTWEKIISKSHIVEPGVNLQR